MPLNKQKVEVIKVNCDRPVCRPKKFPRMPIMYLELIENKDKIKQDMINKEYVPPPIESSDQETQEQGNTDYPEQSENLEDSKNIEIPATAESMLDKDLKEDYKESEVRNYKNNSENSSKKIREYREDPPRPKEFDSEDSEHEVNRQSDSDSAKDYRYDSNRQVDPVPDRGHSNYPSDSEDSPDRRKPRDYASDSEGSEDDDISKKIKKLLKKDRSRDRSAGGTPQSRSRDYSPREGAKPSDGAAMDSSRTDKNPVKDDKSRDRVEIHQPPTLAELKNKGQYVERKTFRNITVPTINEQEEEDLKREMLFKFELLKKSYKNSNIPEFTIHSDYNTMLKSYNMTLKQVSLDNSVENYKQYLMAGFMLVEFLGSSFLKLDMSGFTQQQMVNMSSYERLLIELGEKSYVPDAKSLPVELRLLFMILMNAGIFIVTKMIMKKTGSNLSNLFGGGASRTGINSNTSGFANTEGSVRPPKRKMNGPNINVDELPDVNA